MNNKSAFWKALVFTIIIFVIGFLLGAYLETQRASNLASILENSEIDLLDEQVRTKVITDFHVRCDVSKENLFEFADRIYVEADKLERDDQATKFIDDLKSIHKRYDLLRMLLWTQATELKESCGNLHTVVYVYEYNTEDIDKHALQISYSRVLLDLKNAHPNDVLLIPIAGNMNLTSISTVLEDKNVSSLPVIIVDDKVFSGLVSVEEIGNIL